LTGHVGTHASGFLSAQDSTERCTCDTADCRADRTTHDSADNSPTGNSGREASSGVGLASGQWKSQKGNSQGGAQKTIMHGSSPQEAKEQRCKA
jgi:hypothetical protein